MRWDVIEGDARIVLRRDFFDASVDSAVCDPPYELGFMGRKWDGSGVSYDPHLWRQVLRVLKPGGHLLAFGGTRTYHRMACAIEDAGFEVRDSIHWIYGSGFPKSLDASKAIDKASPATDAARQWAGWGTALKPAHEPIVVARKPLDGTVAANVLAHGTGAINVDGCRVSASGPSPSVERRKGKPLPAPSGVWPTHHDRSAWSAPHPGEDLGRWPPNILLSHAPDCGDECADGCAVAEMDGQSGESKSVGRAQFKPRTVYSADAKGYDIAGKEIGYGDTGGASRFFPVFRYQAKAPTSERLAASDGTRHPTQKPVALMRWLVRLVTPKGGLVLDPFTGSGSTGVAALSEGLHFKGIELSPEYAKIARARIGATNKGAA